MTLRVGFVTGTTPDKWARTWDERHPHDRIELVPVTEAEQETQLRDGTLDMCLVRLPIDRDGLHCVPLYDEVQVAVAAKDHLVAAADEVTWDDLAEEQLVLPHPSGWTPSVPQLDWPAMTAKDAIEVVASGTGVVVVPMSVARLHARKDVVSRPVVDAGHTTVGLAWKVDADGPRVQDFVGVVRGRTARSSRG